MNTVCYISAYIFEQFISYIYFSSKFSTKKPKYFTFLSFASSFIFQYLINQIGIPYLNLLAFFICNFLILLLCYHASIKQIIFNVALLEGTMIATEIVTMYILSLIFGTQLSEYMVDTTILLYSTITTKILYFMIVYLFSKLSLKETNKKTVKDFSLILFILPLMSIVTIVSFVYLSLNEILNSTAYTIFSLVSLILLLSNIIIFWVHERVINTLNENMEYQIDKQRTEYHQEYYDELQRQYDLSEILIHDIQKHLRVIREFSDKQDSNGIIKYIDSVYESGEIQSIRQFSDNKLVNVIINRYASLCKKDHIELICDIRSIDFSSISESDLTSLLDNLLENSYEAAISSGNKFIDLKIDTFNENYIVFSIKNSCDKAPKKANGRFLSSKENPQSHGIGIKSIKRIATKYNGHTKFDYNADKNIFSAQVVLTSTQN